MKIYLVGGAVRDVQLGLPVKDHDFVVIGGTPKKMIDKGFKSVGRDFPVFIDPKTGYEYALARSEYKTAPGHRGFTCHFDASITLEDDLKRRDLTINAMALDLETQNIIDPYHGRRDLNNRLLRHVSPAFSEDPLRVLRVARFLSCYQHLGFSIAPETEALCRHLIQMGALSELTLERVFMETQKALLGKNPIIFFEILHQWHALDILYPDIQWGEDLRKALIEITSQSNLLDERFSILAPFFNIDTFHKRCSLPRNLYDLGKQVIYMNAFHIVSWTSENILDFIIRCNALRKTERFIKALKVSQILRQIQNKDLWPLEQLVKCLTAIQEICTKDLFTPQDSPAQRAKIIYAKQLNTIENLRLISSSAMGIEF